MEFTEELVGDAVIVRVQGRLDSSTAQHARERLALVHNVSPRIAIDLTKVPYVSSAGLQVLLVLARRIRPLKGKIVLFGIAPNVRDVFSISGFDMIFTITPDNDSALAALALS